MTQLNTEWRPVPGFPYEVSSTGFVRNARTGYVLTPMRTGTRRRGAQRSKVRFSTRPRIDFDVAHLVLTAFVGPRPPGHVAMHADDNSANNAASNLRWGTHVDNCNDMAEKVRGGQQRVTPAIAAEIRQRRHAGETGAAIARAFGVSQQLVCGIFKERNHTYMLVKGK